MESHYVVVAISTTVMNMVSMVMGFGAWMTIGPSCPKAESLTIYLIGITFQFSKKKYPNKMANV